MYKPIYRFLLPLCFLLLVNKGAAHLMNAPHDRSIHKKTYDRSELCSDVAADDARVDITAIGYNNGIDRGTIIAGFHVVDATGAGLILRNFDEAESLILKPYTTPTSGPSFRYKNILAIPSSPANAKSKNRYVGATAQFTPLLVLFTGLFLFTVSIGILLYKKNKRLEQLIMGREKLIDHKLNLLALQIPKPNTHSDALKEVVNLAIVNAPTFFLRFKETDPDFHKKLMEVAPNLVFSELELCARLRLGFQTKEIARCTGSSVRGVEGKKFRIRKKLKLSATEDLRIWMMNL